VDPQGAVGDEGRSGITRGILLFRSRTLDFTHGDYAGRIAGCIRDDRGSAAWRICITAAASVEIISADLQK